jgi:hypothetical protein
MKHTTKNQVNSRIVFLVVVFYARHLRTSFQVYILAAKWDICYRCEYIGPSFPSSILSQISISLFPELYLSRHLFIFSKMSGYARGWTCRSSRLLWNYCLPILKPRMSTFHTSPSLRISFVDHRFGRFKKYSVPNHCFLCPCPFAISN